MLDLAEDARRYNQAPDPVLDLSAKGSAGSNGPIASGELMLDARGCERGGSRERASWTALLAGRLAQRGAKPAIAAARDLAQAYHYLDYYCSAAYALPELPRTGSTVSGSWRADRLIAQIATKVIELGGDPTALELRSDYMRAGIQIALGALPWPS